MADTLSRNVPTCGAAHVTDVGNLSKLHELLCLPGVARLTHFTRERNYPYSIEDVEKITQRCDVCTKIKQRFSNLLKKIW